MCDPDITEQGEAELVSEGGSECAVTVTMKHAGGCHIYTASALARFLAKHPWFPGAVMVVLGPIIALCGKRFFPWVAATLGALAAIDSVIVLFFESGLVTTWWATVLVCLLALATGILVGVLLRRQIRIAVIAVGAIAGGMLGAYLFEVVFAIWNIESSLGLVATGLVFAIGGGFLANAQRCLIVIFGTSFIGSYMFMRGWTFFFGGYPSEQELFAMWNSGEPVELDSKFWIYMAVLGITFAFTSFWQHGKDLEHHAEVEALEVEKEDEYTRV